jgi:hypothetical protein
MQIGIRDSLYNGFYDHYIMFIKNRKMRFYVDETDLYLSDRTVYELLDKYSQTILQYFAKRGYSFAPTPEPKPTLKQQIDKVGGLKYVIMEKQAEWIERATAKKVARVNAETARREALVVKRNAEIEGKTKKKRKQDIAQKEYFAKKGAKVAAQTAEQIRIKDRLDAARKNRDFNIDVDAALNARSAELSEEINL